MSQRHSLTTLINYFDHQLYQRHLHIYERHHISRANLQPFWFNMCEMMSLQFFNVSKIANTIVLWFLLIIYRLNRSIKNELIIILVSECVTSSHNSHSMYQTFKKNHDCTIHQSKQSLILKCFINIVLSMLQYTYLLFYESLYVLFIVILVYI